MASELRGKGEAMKYIWKVKIHEYNWSSAVYEVAVVANSISEALERAYVAAYKEKRWRRGDMDCRYVERLEQKVFI